MRHMYWKESFDKALLRFVQTTLGKPDAAEITYFDQVMREMGVCETCGYSTAFIEINFRDKDGKPGSAEWQGDFGMLLTNLTEE